MIRQSGRRERPGNDHANPGALSQAEAAGTTRAAPHARAGARRPSCNYHHRNGPWWTTCLRSVRCQNRAFKLIEAAQDRWAGRSRTLTSSPSSAPARRSTTATSSNDPRNRQPLSSCFIVGSRRARCRRCQRTVSPARTSEPAVRVATQRALCKPPPLARRVPMCAGFAVHVLPMFTRNLLPFQPYPGRLAASLRHVPHPSGLELLRRLSHARTPPADGEPAHPSGRRRKLPTLLACRSTREVPS
jgi:hypothetical protein